MREKKRSTMKRVLGNAVGGGWLACGARFPTAVGTPGSTYRGTIGAISTSESELLKNGVVGYVRSLSYIVESWDDPELKKEREKAHDEAKQFCDRYSSSRRRRDADDSVKQLGMKDLLQLTDLALHG